MAEIKKSAAKKTTAKKAVKTTAVKKAVATKTPAKKAVSKKVPARAAGTKKPVGTGKGDPTYQQIAELAHRYWAERGGHHGSDREDWLRAERDLRAA